MPPCAQARSAIHGAVEPHDGRGRIPANERFYPHDKLKKILTRERITEILNCSCERCKQYRRDLKLIGQPSDYIGEILDNAISLFALMISIDAAPFAVSFLNWQVNDKNISNTAEDPSVKIGEKYWSHFHRKRREDSKLVEDGFRDHWFQFAIPTLTSPVYHIFHADTILPFVEQVQLGKTDEDGRVVNEGAYGTVYACKIWPAYNKLPNSEGIDWFVRKELDVPTRLFNAERENLEMANRLQDPHIVKIIKTYKHGNKYNIIFPRSRTNLRHYLREDRFENPTSPVEANPLWQQVLGVAKALHRIIYFDVNTLSTSNEVGYYGFHFDLKPENILVEDNDTLLISDFGQATFVKRGGSSRVDGHGGTEAYAPPEIDNLNERQTRRYDIWSLGCVLIEIVTVIVRGSRDLEEFDRLRVTSTANMTDDRFFEIDPTFEGPGRKYRIKAAILDWIEALPRRVTSSKSREFLEEIVCLIKEMLAVDASKRAWSGEVVRRLSDILRRNHERNDVQLELPAARDGESAVGATELSKIKYALGKRDLDEEELLFRGTTPSAAYAFEDDKFSFSIPRDTYQMQSVLTGQCVEQSCVVQEVEYTPAHERIGKLTRWLKGHKLHGIEKACVVQLWKETDYTGQELGMRSNRVRQSMRPPRDLVQVENLPLNRLAIFHSNRIVVVPISLNWTIEMPSNEADLKFLRIIPRDATKDPYVNAATLDVSADKGTENYFYPGIPLDTSLLRKQEESNRFECSKIILHFNQLEERDAFYEKFKGMRNSLKNKSKRPSS
ncbi:putative serine/threonine-protein kinase fnkE [Talaromyces islandicus]|uniref:Putative serine/threonine-protein kinase fnkE n=1 Tax=Talaromyces islandicus TaxID=28573 RepID=A0A0U1M743_TALIS|nr:putative serine/threonine-protein kinase fnkE [Talaromyces islandicus]